LKCKINGNNIADLSAMEISELIKTVKSIKDPVATSILDTLVKRWNTWSTSDWRSQSESLKRVRCPAENRSRIKMVKHLSGSLVDVMYIFDEPSIGLHPRDVHRLE